MCSGKDLLLFSCKIPTQNIATLRSRYSSKAQPESLSEEESPGSLDVTFWSGVSGAIGIDENIHPLKGTTSTKACQATKA